jgi:O-methyltransferase involved in polyketide biosynthesis
VTRTTPRLGRAQETLLIPLYGRAMETKKKRPLLRDPKAIDIVESIDYDFRKFDRGLTLIGAVLRTAMYDEWVRQFVEQHPSGTVVEIGAGLNTRFERLDNGRIHWVDMDLPDAAALRARYFTDNARRVTVGASVLDSPWMDVVKRFPPPYFLVAEAVFIYLPEAGVRGALSRIATAFPGASFAFDTAQQRMFDDQRRRGAMQTMAARMQWACDHPRIVEAWKIGLRLVETRTFLDAPLQLWERLPFSLRVLGPIFFRRRVEAYRLNLFELVRPVI